jgi:hypothetical protein
MAEFRLGRLKFNWKGDWQINTAYVIDDIVKLGGNVYVCTQNHTSVGSTSNWFSTDLSKWNIHTDGIRNTGDFVTNRYYLTNDIFKYGNKQYRVTTGFSTNFFTTVGAASTNFVEYVSGFNGEGNYNSFTEYQAGDVVVYNGNSYVAITTTGIDDFPNLNIGTKWQVLSPGTNPLGINTYRDTETYNQGDLVQIGGDTYRLKVGVATGINPVLNQLGIGQTSIVSGVIETITFSGGGTVVGAANSQYFSVPGFGGSGSGATFTISRNGSGDVNTVGINQPGVGYSATEQLTVFGALIGGTTPSDNLTVTVGTTTSFITGGGAASASDTWELFNTGLNFVGTWSTTTTYYKNSVVEYASSAYVAIGNSAINGVIPGTDPTQWGALAIGDSNALLTDKGDILIRDDSAPTRLGIGETFQALGVSTTGLPVWTTIGDATRVYYVDPELGEDTFNGSTPDLAFKTLRYASETASAVTNITNFVYSKESGISTITAPSHGILYPNITIKLDDIEFECLSGGNSYDIQNVIYANTTGITTITTTATNFVQNGDIVRLRNIEFTCPGGSGITTTIFPDGTQGYNFTVTQVNSPTEFEVNVGTSTIPHIYVQGGLLFVGVTTTVFPDTEVGSYFNVVDVLDNDTFTVNVGTSTITHTYVSGGTVTNLSPAVIRLSASEFAEQLPIVVPPFTSIVGNTLRASKIRPADGLSPDNITPNNRQTMFKLSDATTIQGLNVSGLVGFNYDPTRPYELDATTIRAGSGTTACGIYFAFNENSPILNKSPYVKDCTSFGDPATDGNGGGAGVGVFIDGGVHPYGNKSMVFDAYTNVLSDGAGFVLDRDARAEIVSCFTYYARWGYYSGGGSRIRSVAGNNSYGDYGVIASGFSTGETPISGRLLGDRLEIITGSIKGTVAVGDSIRGTESGAYGNILNDQSSSDRYYFLYENGYGDPNVGIGTTTFILNEWVDVIGAGTTGAFRISGVVGSISGQKGVILEVDELEEEPLVGSAVGFTTTAAGVGTDSRYYIITTVTGFTTSFEVKTSAGIVTYRNRATIRIAPEKPSGTIDTRNIVGTANTFYGSYIEVREKFSNARLTGHDFLSVGTGNKVTTNYPDVDEGTVQQGNETNVFGPGKVFYVSTDQGGNFRVGDLFAVNQLTGSATLDASAFNLSGLTELRLGSLGGQIGEAINEFSSDETMSGNSNSAVPTEFAVVGYLKRAKMGNDAMVTPVGTDGQRPLTPNTGALRYNTTRSYHESYNGTSWVPVGQFYNVNASSNTSVEAFQQVWVNTSGGAVTLTLPSAPNIGDTIRFFDAANTFDSNALTVDRNGQRIQGDLDNLTVNLEGAAFELVYSGNASFGWRLFTV